jgi:hypothetical protein
MHKQKVLNRLSILLVMQVASVSFGISSLKIIPDNPLGTSEWNDVVTKETLYLPLILLNQLSLVLS